MHRTGNSDLSPSLCPHRFRYVYSFCFQNFLCRRNLFHGTNSSQRDGNKPRMRVTKIKTMTISGISFLLRWRTILWLFLFRKYNLVPIQTFSGKSSSDIFRFICHICTYIVYSHRFCIRTTGQSLEISSGSGVGNILRCILLPRRRTGVSDVYTDTDSFSYFSHDAKSYLLLLNEREGGEGWINIENII